ncbi:Uncharacterised protein [Salmonella bongori]|nr:Uncharacterised protein [Salmonella bongori]
MHNDGHFVSIRRIVRDTVRDSQRLNVAVAIFVLQTFAVQGRTTGSSADQEAARLLVTRSPAQVANTLEPEHGVVDVERIIGRLLVLYEVAAASQDAPAPSSLIPSCRIWPFSSSL